MTISLFEARLNSRKNFIDYNSFINLSMKSDPQISASYDPTLDFELFQELKNNLKTELNSRDDKKELMGLSASQVGLPIKAIYIEKDKKSSVLLIDPKIGPSPNEADPELFIKLIKCPTSPAPYHLGLFIKSATIRSATSRPYNLTYDPKDPTFNFSANLQRIIWADNGVLPGDDSPIPINYLKACSILDKSKEFKKHFKCTIHKDEINNIVSNPYLMFSLDNYSYNISILYQNLLTLLARNINKEWIKIPSINLFKERI